MMVDVSKTIVSGDWILAPRGNMVHLGVAGITGWWLTDQQARDLWQALNVWVERNAVVE
jgi:hypothetical protein